MKKLIGFIIAIILIALGWIYFIIPSNIRVTSESSFQAPAIRTIGLVNNEQSWKKWWKADQPGSFNNNIYKVEWAEGNMAHISITSKNADSSIGRILVANRSIDSSIIEWETSFKASLNPIKKIQQYYFAKQLKTDMHEILSSLKTFAEKPENIYGMQIHLAKVTDTALIAIRKRLDHYPNSNDIYTLVDELRNYIQSQKAIETNSPMMNVLGIGKNDFEIMVGIPTNKLLNDKGDIKQKRMVPGNILWAEVKGGNERVTEAFEQLENFKYDKRLNSPAIPFALLITDRRNEPDSNNWVTKLYYPIF